jgi:hypothetical protein
LTTVNVTNSLAIPDATRNAPYYDDLDETKGFLRILARPGFAVQAREFTQSQSLQQVQLERFARHIFVNGSMVYGGQISYDKAITLNLETQYANVDVDVNDFIGKRLTHNSGNSLVIAQVLAGENATATDPPVLMIKYLTGDEFSSSTIIKVEDEEIRACTNSSSSGFKANGLTASVGDGVFFINGFFVRNQLQNIVLEKFNQQANARVGLEVDETIVTELDDTSLLDPAQESGNFQAPGAARLKMELTLAKRSLTSTDDTAFIELLRVENGQRVKQIKNAIYSELEETLARRTFDESGSYTVRPFRIQFKDDSANSQNIIVRLDAGKAYVFGYEFETISPTDIVIPRPRVTSNVTGLDVTMAYGNYTIVSDPKGVFDFSTLSVVDIHCVPYGSSNNLNTATYAWSKAGTARIRNFVYEGAANTANGNTHYYRAYLSDTRFTSINSNAAVVTSNSIQMYDQSAKFSIDNTAYVNCTVRIVSGTGQGQALRVTSYDGQSKNLRLANAFSTLPTTSSNVSIDFSFKDAESLIIATAGGSYTANADISPYAKISGNSLGDALILEGTYQSLVFPLANRFIKDKTGFNNFMYRKNLGTVTFTAGATSSIAAPTGQAWAGGTGALSDTNKRTHYVVIPTSISSGTNVFVGKPLSFDVSRGASVTVSGSSLTFNAGLPGDTFNATIFADLEVNTGSGTLPKQKTLFSPNVTYTPAAVSNGSFISSFGSNSTVYLVYGQVHIQAPNKTPGITDSLLVSDVKRINAIYDLAGTALSQNQALTSFSEISSKYIFDSGQRDTFYDHGTIKLKNGVSPPTGPIVVCFQYYDHGAFGGGDSDGFFSLESYPNVTTTAGYGDVPFYIPESGEPIALGDAIDFRPKRANADNTSPSFTLSGFKAIVPNEEFTVNYDYYLPRKDLVVLTRDRVFKVIQGTSSITPYPPNDPDDAMVLYRLSLPPYVTAPSEIITRFVENRRYTMRDIGKLETRIQNLEYYGALNTLEKAANDLIIRDSNGLERTKFGIVCDNFIGHQIGDVTNVDYLCSMDFVQGMLRPAANTRAYKLLLSTYDSNGQRNGSTVTLKYTEENMVVQNAASKAENLNPYMIARFIGNTELTPDSDVWIDTDRKPDIVANLSGSNDAYQKMADAINATTAMQTEWGGWETHVTGTQTSTTYVNTKTGASSTDPAFVNNRQAPGNATGPVVQKTTTTTSGTATRTGVQQQVSFENMTESLGDKVIDVSIIPYIRPLQVVFQASGLRPRRQVWFFFDQVPVLNYVQKPNVLRTRNANRFVSLEGINERITSTSTNSASVLASRPYESNTSQSVLLLANTIGLFAVGDTITGGTSGNTAVVDSFEHFSGNVVGGNTTTVTLQVGANRSNTDYVGNTIHIVAGSGLGQNATISAYDYQARNVTVTPAFSVPPTSNSKYSIGIHKTTNEGIVVGTYHLPSTDSVKFRTGDRMFRVLDQQDNDLDNATTRSDARFTAQGLRQTKEAISVSVTVPKLTTATITETKAVTSTVTQQTTVRHDPLAQTFFVAEDQFPNGVFVTSVEIYFKSKSDTLPVWVQLRPTVNGFPHSYMIYPFAYKTLYPDEVSISDVPNAGNTQTKTIFTFSNPVYLQPGEHALIVQSDSLDYEAYVAELGKRQIGSDRVISEQPYLGSLFKSQNASTWTPFQFEDLMFVINKALFTVGSTNIYFDSVPAIANAAMDHMFVQTNALVLSNTSVQNAYEVTEYSTGVLDSTFNNFVADSTHKFTTRKTVTTRQGSANIRATLSTVSPDVSPMVDISRYNLLAIENIINNANLSNAMLTISNGGLSYSNIQNISITITGGSVGTAANAKASANASGNLTGVYLDTLGSYYIDRATVSVVGGAASQNAVVNVASELDSQGGPARARYITRKVILTDGFDAGDLRVFLTAYRPNGTELYCYYRVMNSDDPEKFENKQWSRMAMATSLNRRSTKESDFIEYEFRPSTNSNTIVYTAGPTTFNSFNQYQIKIILLADDTITIPMVKDMRCIALPPG